MGVSTDVRAHIQRHGLRGVQNRHYNRHTYIAEKAQALRMWAEFIASPQIKKTLPLNN